MIGKKISLMVICLIFTGFLAIPDTFGMPGPHVTLLDDGNPRLSGTSQTLTFNPGNFPLDQAFSVWIAEPGSSIVFNSPISGAFTLLCSDNDGEDNPDTVEYFGDTDIWQLVDDNGEPVLVTLTAMTDIFQVSFGTIGGTAEHDILSTDTTLTIQNGDVAVLPLKWQNVQTETNFADGIGDEKSETTMDALGIWRFGFCGNDAVNDPLVADQVSQNVESWQVVSSDVDGDEVSDAEDNCPFISNPAQEDVDDNGIGDACQDVDGDEVLDIEDNCPFISNPTQEDVDENGIGDACEEQIELLVEATFPPGDTISVELPEDPDTGIFSIALELPETQGGEVLIETTDAGDTPANFKFLGHIIDFNAPCADNCEISFTFTQDLLNEQGITLEQVTIFHDMNENLSFEADEAIPTVVTGDDPFTATASASFTSKFSVGGIKALALGALAGGGGASGGNAPSLENLSFDGVQTVHEDGTIGFGGLILDEISYVNNFPTQTVQTQTPFELIFPFYEDNGAKAIQHVAVYVLHSGIKTVGNSELYLIYDAHKPLKIHDPHGYVSDFKVDVKEKSSHDVDFIFGITFATPMEKSDIVLRVWDNHRRSNDYMFKQLLHVVPSDSNIESNSEELLTNSQILTPQDDLEKTQNESSFEIPIWIKYNADWWSQKEISDDDFIAGIKYLIEDDIIKIPEILQEQNNEVKEIPEWIRSSAEWWANDLLSDKEFVQSIQWIIKEGIMTI